MWVFIREVLAGALIILLLSSIAVPSFAQTGKSYADFKTGILSVSAQQASPLTLKFDGIDLSSFEKASERALQKDIYSRVRSAVRRAEMDATSAEMERASQKIIKLLRSDYIRQELARNDKVRVVINVDLTFQPLTTAATFQF